MMDLNRGLLYLGSPTIASRRKTITQNNLGVAWPLPIFFFLHLTPEGLGEASPDFISVRSVKLVQTLLVYGLYQYNPAVIILESLFEGSSLHQERSTDTGLCLHNQSNNRWNCSRERWDRQTR